MSDSGVTCHHRGGNRFIPLELYSAAEEYKHTYLEKVWEGAAVLGRIIFMYQHDANARIKHCMHFSSK